MPKALERKLERQAARKYPYPKTNRGINRARRKRIRHKREGYVYGTMNKLGLLRK